MYKGTMKHFISRANTYVNQHRSFISFLIVILSIGIIDFLFNKAYPDIIIFLNNSLGITINVHESIDLGFAPEIWGGVLAMVLGTLIIVIALAAETTPKLMDLFVKDWRSLLFIWFMILASLHAAFFMFYAESLNRNSSVLLNIYGFLFISTILSIPYIFYILLYSKTDNVIQKLYQINEQNIKYITTPILKTSMSNQSVVESYQYELMSTIDQFDDLLEYINFKEAQTEIIRRVGDTIKTYMDFKHTMSDNFFLATPTIRNNPTFRTYVENQYKELEERKTFYEVKAFRMLGNAYIRKMENGESELASLIVSEVTDIGQKALHLKQEGLITDINIRFNTFMRFSIKHAVRNNEPRNLYNLAFMYSKLLIAYVDHDRQDLLKQGYFYFKWYGNEIYKHAANNPALYFIVDTLTSELKKVCIHISEKGWDDDIQEHLLGEILQLDNPPDYSKDEIDQNVNNGVRVLQIGLALHYLKIDKKDYAEKIVNDVLDDLAYFDTKRFQKTMEGLYARIKFSGPTFWEDTDRGNTNIYYSPDAEYIDDFKKIFSENMKKRLNALDRDVQFLKLELDKLQTRDKNGEATVSDKSRISELTEQINTRRKTFFIG